MNRKGNFIQNSIRVKLILLFLSISLIPIAIIGIISVNNSYKALEESKYIQLETLGNLKASDIIGYFDNKLTELEILAESKDAILSYNKLKAYHDNGGALADGSFNINTNKYKEIYNEIDPFFSSYIKSFHFNDLYFICAKHGHIMYSSEMRDEMGTNLSSGKYRNSGLAKLWSEINENKKPVLTDFSHFESIGKAAAFMGTPLFNENNELIAIIAMEIKTDKINNIMNENAELDETGETYIVGDDNLMRTDSRFSEKSTILSQKVETESVTLAHDNKIGVHIIKDYRGIEVLSYYSPLKFNEEFVANFDWVIISEIDTEEAFHEAVFLRNDILIVSIIITLIVVLIAFLFAKYFTKPIIQLTNTAELVAQGDLRQEFDIKNKDEFGILALAFKKMTKNLREQINAINEVVSVLTTSNNQLISTISELATSSGETSTTVAEVSSTIEEVKQTAEISNQKAKNVVNAAQKSVTISENGIKSSEDSIDGMHKIQEQVNQIAETIIRLSEQSQTIGEITSSVNDIAEQSNLLAVNASIEAVKAGEYGKGFGVVAHEIRTLANESKQSTKQIRDILSEIQKSIGSAVMATEEGGKAVEKGMELSETSGDSITILSDSISSAAQASVQIATSSQQQLTGMEQLTEAMENIKQASSQNATGAKQAEEAVENIINIMQNLKSLVEKYKLK